MRSKLKPPQSPNPEMDRVIQKIYDDLNQVIDNVHTDLKGRFEPDDKSKEGSIAVVKEGDTYSIRGKTEDGWAKTSLTLIGSEKPGAKKEQQAAETIEIIQGAADDIPIPSADYDSGWRYFLRNDARVHEDPPMQIFHNLSVLPKIVIIYFAPDQGSGSLGDSVAESEITWFTEMDTDMGSGYDHGAATYISRTEVRIHAADNQTLVGSDFVLTAADHRSTYQNGSIRVLLWK